MTIKASDLDTFTRQYLETGLWSSTDNANDDTFTSGGEPLDANYTLEDFAPEALERAVKDCKEFREQAGVDLDGIEDSQAAHDFWLTRNRHGAGFWDRGLGAVGQRLTDTAHGFGEADIYIGDDGRLYFS